MTFVTEERHNGNGAALSVAEKRERARAALRADPELKGAEVARMFDMPADWGRKQMRAVRAESPAGTDGTAPPGPDRTPKRTERTRQPARPKGTVGTHWALRAGVVLGELVVAAVAAVGSYMHIRDLALTVGMGDYAYWLPLALDGLVLLTTCQLAIDRKERRTVDRVARVALGFALGTTLLANALAYVPDLVPLLVVQIVLAVVPPIALTVVVHGRVLRMAGER